MGASRSFFPAPAARALFLSLAMAAAASAFFPGSAAAGAPLPRPPGHLDAGSNSISAAPSLLLAVPASSTYPPASAPDAMPILPTPTRGAGRSAPAGTTMPVIPSNPSPPNPDQFGPTSAQAPAGFSAAAVAPSSSSAAAALRSGACQAAAGALLLLLLLQQRWF